MGRYTPGQVGDYLLGQELQKVANAIDTPNKLLQLDKVYASPTKVRAGMIAYADGVTWDPGAGPGAYIFDGTNWDRLDTPIGWRDLIGPIGTKAGANDPTWASYRGSINAYTFNGVTTEAFFIFHMPHDYVLASDMFIHMHWSQNVVDTGGAAGVPGVVEWNFDISYADGHGTAGGAADPFIAPITVTITQQASTTQYGHMIAEVQFTAAAGAGGLIASEALEIDGLILVRAYRVKANDTLDQAPFGHTCDIHYQSNGLGTKNKAPNFYT